MMDRIIGKTISANIRYGGASKSPHGDMVQDTIAEELRRGLGRRGFVRRGTIIETGSGELVYKGVRRIYHIASVEGQGPGKGVRAAEGDITDSVQRILKQLEKHNGGLRLFTRRYTSVLLPMLGAGDGGLEVETVARLTVEAVNDYFTTTPEPHLQEVYLLAFTSRDLAAIENAMTQAGGFTQLAD
jgi:O-acetyl-ADP-ribose deacetylase (regulator of RNase III)